MTPKAGHYIEAILVFNIVILVNDEVKIGTEIDVELYIKVTESE